MLTSRPLVPSLSDDCTPSTQDSPRQLYCPLAKQLPEAIKHDVKTKNQEIFLSGTNSLLTYFQVKVTLFISGITIQIVYVLTNKKKKIKMIENIYFRRWNDVVFIQIKFVNTC